jgi:ABC-type xylose transport system substrate-binding protein
LSNGSSGWICASDRNLKNEITPVDGLSVLKQVVELPVATWSFRTVPGVRHVGPMAQDFMAAFHLGNDNKMISAMDANGVALAAIQGLAQVQKETDARLAAKDAEIAALKLRLAVVEQTQRADIAVLKQSLAELRAALETTTIPTGPLALRK